MGKKGTLNVDGRASLALRGLGPERSAPVGPAGGAGRHGWRSTAARPANQQGHGSGKLGRPSAAGRREASVCLRPWGPPGQSKLASGRPVRRGAPGGSAADDRRLRPEPGAVRPRSTRPAAAPCRSKSKAQATSRAATGAKRRGPRTKTRTTSLSEGRTKRHVARAPAGAAGQRSTTRDRVCRCRRQAAKGPFRVPKWGPSPLAAFSFIICIMRTLGGGETPAPAGFRPPPVTASAETGGYGPGRIFSTFGRKPKG